MTVHKTDDALRLWLNENEVARGAVFQALVQRVTLSWGLVEEAVLWQRDGVP